MLEELEPDSAEEKALRLRVPNDVWVVVRRMVEEDPVSIAEIARRTGLPESTITSKVRREGWLRKWQLAQELASCQPEERKRLIARLYAAFEKQVSALEAKLRKLAGDPQAIPEEVDATAKALTSLAKTLDMLLELQQAHGNDEGGEESDDHIRDKLSQRIASLCEQGQAE